MPEFQNPNLQSGGPGGGSGGDMRATMSFMLLAILLFFGYEYFFAKPKTPPPAPPAQTQSQKAQPAQQSATSAPEPASASKASKAAPQAAKAAQPSIVAASETQTTVENEFYKIVLSNRGGQIEHWYLKKYNNDEGKPLDMVQPQMAKKYGFPLSFFTYESGLTKQLNNALYKVTVSAPQSAANGTLLPPASVTFRYAANGIDATKTVHFNSSYVISVDAKVTRDGSPVRALISWPAGLGDMSEFTQSSLARTITFQSAASNFSWSLNGKEDSTKAAKVSNGATLNAPYSFAAVSDLYFAAAFLPTHPENTTVVTLHHAVALPASPGQSNSKPKEAEVLGMAMGSTTGVTKLRLFAGPKDTTVLGAIHATGPDGKENGPSLQPLIHFGVLTIVAKPLYYAVRWLRHLLGPGLYSWGWAIVIVGIVLNLLTVPSRLMMMKSSLKMMRIQPKVDALKRKYAHLKMNDPKRQEMNTEMMHLYKSEGVSLYGGCLPMLIQMPLLWAIYEVLENAIELRQAHWFWLSDLSAPDPLYILPILIIVSMFLVQYITPSPGMDPSQRRMMAFVMPVIFGFMMLHLPSGLSLYWVVGNIISLGIQIWINQSGMGKEMHAIAARRAAKKKGSPPQRSLARR